VYLAAVVALFFVIAVIAPGVLDTTDPLALHLSQALQAPGPGHWFGTDEAGRDLWSRVVHGARPSLAIGVGATAVSLVLALVLGSLAALGGRVVAPAVDRVVEVLFSFPSLLLALLLVALLGPSALTEAIAVGVGTAPGYARMIRGQILSAKGSAYVEAALTLGHSPARILRRHVLPNAVRPLVAIMALSIGQSIVWASSLSFLGLGVSPPSSEWGALLEAGRPYVAHAWWLTVVPGLVIVALALAVTTLGKHLQSLLERSES
jgi:peptide/nickel transport system permease protein